jgi:hypothetical protein
MSEKSNEVKELFKAFTSTATLGELFKLSNHGNKHSMANNIMKYWQAHCLELKDFKNVCKGAGQWKTMGYWINKGAKALYIYAPIHQKQEKDEKTGEYKHDGDVLRFILVPVFDVCQTTGYADYVKDTETLAEKVYRNGFPVEDALKLAEKLGCKVSIAEAGANEAQGWYRPDTKEIQYNNGSTLLHEVGHAVTWEKGNSYAKNELLAEMFCLAVYNKYDMEFNFNYANIWNSRLKEMELDYTEFCSVFNKIKEKADSLMA